MSDFAASVQLALDRDIRSCEPIAGGDINRGWRVETADGDVLFGKSRPGGSVEEFANEAAGLNWLGEVGALPVPGVVAVVDHGDEPGLILEWVEPGPRGEEAGLGRGLALVHQAGAEGFDRLAPGATGGGIIFGEAIVPLNPAPPPAGFAGAYAGRLRNLAGQAHVRGALGASDRDLIEKVADRANELAGPIEPPARVHGDLWSGNVLWSQRRPWLIDPAAHGAHRELDLAMLELFGSPGPSFYAAYEEVEPLAGGYRERIGFWQIQPLLVHAVLFNGGYGHSAAAAAARYLA
ncbi:MAG: fructosamine kinase family protein [Solirubrobacterales bacterium]|nr:fructosamine kinase family protein [Solirubrobacterales bacterium]MCB8915533.1 fructosamine kinase family protein [Thermoleophilales bacterium]